MPRKKKKSVKRKPHLKYLNKYKNNFVSPKKAFAVLFILTVIIVAAFIGLNFFYTGSQPTVNHAEPASQPSQKATDLNNIIEKKNSRQALTAEEQALLNKAIEEKAKEKTIEITNSAKTRSFNQDEVNYLLNPKTSAEKDLGINTGAAATAVKAKPLTPDEIDALLNPKKK